MNPLLRLVAVLLVLGLVSECSGADSRWVWGGSRGRQSQSSPLSGNRDLYNNKRSEVYEEVDEDGEDLDEQKSGIGGGYGQSNGLRGGYYPGAGPLPPPGVRPGGPLPPPGVGPLGPLPPPGGRPIGPLPPPGVRPIGPGPPQGVRPPGYYPRPPLGPGPDVDSLINDPTYFEKCTCQPAFNCKQPALIFGSCDVEKQYCCEKFGTPDVLVGPGGPVDPINRRPYPQGGPPPPIYSRAKARQ